MKVRSIEKIVDELIPDREITAQQQYKIGDVVLFKYRGHEERGTLVRELDGDRDWLVELHLVSGRREVEIRNEDIIAYEYHE